VHGASTERAVAGERTALNLAGVDKDELERGMALASQGVLQTSSRIDVKLSLLPSAKPLKSGARVHLHAFASETIATVNLYENKQLKAGAETFAQLRLSAPLLLLPGDRFIIRQSSPVITIGGGVVLDAFPISKQKPEVREQLLTAGASGNHEPILMARIARRGGSGISFQQLVTETGWRANVIAAKLDPLLRNGVSAKVGNHFLVSEAISGLKATLLSALDSFQTQNTLSSGMSQKTLRQKSSIDAELFPDLIAQLVKEGKIEAVGDIVHLRGRGVVMKDEEAESRKLIEQAFSAAGLKVPALKDVLAGLKIDKARAQKLVTLLLRDKVLIKVSDDLVFHQGALNELRKNLAAQKATSPKIDVGRFKELTGVSRKYAIPLLEYLDRERVTRRIGDERVIL
jgi:selenocysteine-specific elongation factor